MDEFRGSPGPWAAGDGGLGSKEHVYAADGQMVADCCRGTREMGLANARLVAASRTMLEEHAEAIGYLEGYAESLTHDGFTRHATLIDALIARMKVTRAAATAPPAAAPG